jgi:hypothetical protein
MKAVLVLAASALVLTGLIPSSAEAQRRGVRAGGGVRPGAARRVVVAGPRHRGVYYRRGYRPGWGFAAGALAVGAAAAASPYYYGGYYTYPAYDPCLQQQRYWTGYGYAWQWVRVC